VSAIKPTKKGGDMKQEKMTKTYGIEKRSDGRYHIVLDVQKSPHGDWLLGSPCYNLNYKRQDFAEKSAHSFVKSLYRDYKPQPELVFLGLVRLG